MTITTAQIRGARGILNWSQQDLSNRTNISTTSIGAIEKGSTQPRESNLAIIRKAFEKGGIEFTSGSGVRLKDETISIIDGENALDEINADIISTLGGTGGEVMIFGLEERADPNSEEYTKIKEHLDKILSSNITERIIVKKGDTNFIAPKEFYRSISPEYFSPYPYFIYGDKLAMVNWGPPMKGLIINSYLFSQTFKKVFNFVWERADKSI
ncbi:MAG: hypothetical protein CL565_03780 [Alphaproteobacteria bacterium]|nr:hypothetical protein [Alphaproteobacteria bacterium]